MLPWQVEKWAGDLYSPKEELLCPATKLTKMFGPPPDYGEKSRTWLEVLTKAQSRARINPKDYGCTGRTAREQVDLDSDDEDDGWPIPAHAPSAPAQARPRAVLRLDGNGKLDSDGAEVSKTMKIEGVTAAKMPSPMTVVQQAPKSSKKLQTAEEKAAKKEEKAAEAEKKKEAKAKATEDAKAAKKLKAARPPSIEPRQPSHTHARHARHTRHTRRVLSQQQALNSQWRNTKFRGNQAGATTEQVEEIDDPSQQPAEEEEEEEEEVVAVAEEEADAEEEETPTLRQKKTAALAQAAKKQKTTKPKYKESEEVDELLCDICKTLRRYEELEESKGKQVQCIDEAVCMAALQPSRKRQRTKMNYAGCE